MSTALVPAEQEKVQEVATHVSSVVEAAQAIEVRTPEHASYAAGFLTEIASAKRQSEVARRVLVDPLNAHVKTINDLFTPKKESLDEADKLVRGKVLTFQQQQKRQQEAEQARLDAIRRGEEEKAEAERRRLAHEAAEAERIATEAEAKRQAEMAARASERRQEIAAMNSDALGVLLGDSEASDEDSRMAQEESHARKTAREAQESAAKARQEAEEAQQREIAVKSAPALAVATPTSLAGVSGRTEWKGTVIDESQVPREYLVVDMKKINAVVKAGVREIPGVKIEQVAGLAVRAQ
jgi:fused signal recognition particle receptor